MCALLDWIKALSPVLATAVAGWGIYKAASLALERFYKERWWEKRLSAFNSQIEAAYLLHRALKYYYDRYDIKLHPDKHHGFIPLNEPEEKDLHRQLVHSIAELEKYQYLGDLLTSKGSVMAVKNFFLNFNKIKSTLFNHETNKQKEQSLNDAMCWSENLLKQLFDEAKIHLHLDGGVKITSKDKQN